MRCVTARLDSPPCAVGVPVVQVAETPHAGVPALSRVRCKITSVGGMYWRSGPWSGASFESEWPRKLERRPNVLIRPRKCAVPRPETVAAPTRHLLNDDEAAFHDVVRSAKEARRPRTG